MGNPCPHEEGRRPLPPLVQTGGLKPDCASWKSVPGPVSDSGGMDRSEPDPMETGNNMTRTRKAGGDLDAIASERAKLQQRMAELDAAEKAAREAQRDAGRGVFLAALEKVKIGAMDRAQARGLAAAIAKHDAAALLRRIGDA